MEIARHDLIRTVKKLPDVEEVSFHYPSEVLIGETTHITSTVRNNTPHSKKVRLKVIDTATGKELGHRDAEIGPFVTADVTLEGRVSEELAKLKLQAVVEVVEEEKIEEVMK